MSREGPGRSLTRLQACKPGSQRRSRCLHVLALLHSVVLSFPCFEPVSDFFELGARGNRSIGSSRQRSPVVVPFFPPSKERSGGFRTSWRRCNCNRTAEASKENRGESSDFSCDLRGYVLHVESRSRCRAFPGVQFFPL